MHAIGRLRHRFHGTYSAVLVLGFVTPDAATAARIFLLGEAWQVTSDPRALVCVMTSADLDAFKAAYAHAIAIQPCGWRHCKKQCKGAAIDSLAHSVDVGPVFTFDASAASLPAPVAKPAAVKRARKARKPRDPHSIVQCAIDACSKVQS